MCNLIIEFESLLPYTSMCVRMLSHYSRVQLFATLSCSPPGSSAHGILQTRMLQWVAMLSSRGSSGLRDQTCVSYVSCIARWVLHH